MTIQTNADLYADFISFFKILKSANLTISSSKINYEIIYLKTRWLILCVSDFFAVTADVIHMGFFHIFFYHHWNLQVRKHLCRG